MKHRLYTGEFLRDRFPNGSFVAKPLQKIAAGSVLTAIIAIPQFSYDDQQVLPQRPPTTQPSEGIEVYDRPRQYDPSHLAGIIGARALTYDCKIMGVDGVSDVRVTGRSMTPDHALVTGYYAVGQLADVPAHTPNC